MSTALATQEQQQAFGTLSGLLKAQEKEIARVVPRHLTPERLMRVALSACSRSPQLLACTPHSILRSVMDAAKLGLEPTGAVGGAYLVPYHNRKTGVWEAQLVTDYRGEMALARRSGEISTISAHVRYSRDKFRYRLGDDEKLEHVPAEDGERGEPIGVYAIAKLKDGGIQRIYLSKAEIEHYRSKSQRKDSGPWETDTQAMWKKTAIRRLCNMLPRSAEYVQHVETEEGSTIDADFTVVSEPEAPQSKTESVKARLRGRQTDENPRPAAESEHRASPPGSDQANTPPRPDGEDQEHAA